MRPPHGGNEKIRPMSVVDVEDESRFRICQGSRLLKSFSYRRRTKDKAFEMAKEWCKQNPHQRKRRQGKFIFRTTVHSNQKPVLEVHVPRLKFRKRIYGPAQHARARRILEVIRKHL